jgi:hypothetical protein
LLLLLPEFAVPVYYLKVRQLQYHNDGRVVHVADSFPELWPLLQVGWLINLQVQMHQV